MNFPPLGAHVIENSNNEIKENEALHLCSQKEQNINNFAQIKIECLVKEEIVIVNELRTYSLFDKNSSGMTPLIEALQELELDFSKINYIVKTNSFKVYLYDLDLPFNEILDLNSDEIQDLTFSFDGKRLTDDPDDPEISERKATYEPLLNELREQFILILPRYLAFLISLNQSKKEIEKTSEKIELIFSITLLKIVEKDLQKKTPPSKTIKSPIRFVLFTTFPSLETSERKKRKKEEEKQQKLEEITHKVENKEILTDEILEKKIKENKIKKNIKS